MSLVMALVSPDEALLLSDGYAMAGDEVVATDFCKIFRLPSGDRVLISGPYDAVKFVEAFQTVPAMPASAAATCLEGWLKSRVGSEPRTDCRFDLIGRVNGALWHWCGYIHGQEIECWETRLEKPHGKAITSSGALDDMPPELYDQAREWSARITKERDFETAAGEFRELFKALHKGASPKIGGTIFEDQMTAAVDEKTDRPELPSTALSGSLALSQGHLNKNIDNVSDGSTYGRVLASRISSGKPWIDFSEGIHSGQLPTNHLATNAPYNLTNDANVDSVDAGGGSGTVIRIFGPGGLGTSYTKYNGDGTTASRPAASLSTYAYSTKYYVVRDIAGGTGYLVFAHYKDSISDGYEPVGTVTTVNSGGSGGSGGGGGTGGGGRGTL